MKIIELLSELIGDELKDAKNYAQKALEYKDEFPSVSRLFSTLSQEEMGHMERLHEAVTTIIRDYRATNGDPPPSMMAVYDYLHKKHIEDATEIKMIQGMYK